VRVQARATRTYNIMAGTAGAGVIFGGGLIGDDGANETIGDVSRAMIDRGVRYVILTCHSYVTVYIYPRYFHLKSLASYFGLQVS